MASGINKLAKAVADILRRDDTDRGYDTTAEVKRIEDGTAWVHFPGGEDETPVRMTVNANVGDNVQVRVSGGRAFIIGNGTAPPTDDRRAIIADENAHAAGAAAQSAIKDAARAKEAADSAQQSADEAQQSATTANMAANGALLGLSTVQDVIGVLTWAEQNAEYQLTADTEIIPGKVYWTRSGSGTSADPYVYTPVAVPVAADLGSYYEIVSVDEAMAEYINSHLALTDAGLYVLKDGSGYRLRLSNDGTYLESPQGYVVNQNTANGNTVRASNGTVIAHLGYGEGNAQSGTAEAPYYTLGIRKSGADIGNYSVVEGEENEASYYCAHAEGYETEASDTASHAEGSLTKASNVYSHAEGIFTTASGGASHSEGDTTTASGMNAHAEGGNTVASGWNSHAAGHGTIAQRAHQTVVGEYNVADTGGSDALDRGTYAFIVGNGTSDSARSNGFTVDWNGTGRFEGSVIAKDYTGTKRMPASSASSDGGRVGWIQSMHSGSNYVLRVSGQYGTTGTTYNTHDFIASASDIRLKKNVEDCEVEDALSVINRIRMRSFDWLHTDEHQKIGFIADELEKIDPKLSVGGGTERDGTIHYKSVDTFYMMGYLVKAVQELSAQNAKLTAELNALKEVVK